MSDYQRATRECAFAELRPELMAAIREHARDAGLDDFESEILICCETLSRRRRAGLANPLADGPDKTYYTAVVVTSGQLIWATGGSRSGATVLSARFSQIEVQDYEAGSFYQFAPDTGLEICGFVAGSAERLQAFIGLGREPAAQRLRQVLYRALYQARYRLRPAIARQAFAPIGV